MSYLLAGKLDDFPTSIRECLGVFRHKVFIERLHWNIPNIAPDATAEWDEFDTGNTVHLIALSATDEVCACARLMPTTRAYLLKEIFSELVDNAALPASASTWELSRFGGTATLSSHATRVAGMSFFPYALALAASLGATSVVGVITHAVARLYRHSGVELQDISQRFNPRRAELLACRIDLSPSTFSKLRCERGQLLEAIHWIGRISEREDCLMSRSCTTRKRSRRASGRRNTDAIHS